MKIHLDTYCIRKKDPFLFRNLNSNLYRTSILSCIYSCGWVWAGPAWARETKMHRSQLYWIHSDTYWIHQIFKGREDVVSVARRQKFPHHTMAGVLHFCPKNIGTLIPKNVLNYCEKYFLVIVKKLFLIRGQQSSTFLIYLEQFLQAMHKHIYNPITTMGFFCLFIYRISSYSFLPWIVFAPVCTVNNGHST